MWLPNMWILNIFTCNKLIGVKTCERGCGIVSQDFCSHKFIQNSILICNFSNIILGFAVDHKDGIHLTILGTEKKLYIMKKMVLSRKVT